MVLFPSEILYQKMIYIVLPPYEQHCNYVLAALYLDLIKFSQYSDAYASYILIILLQFLFVPNKIVYVYISSNVLLKNMPFQITFFKNENSFITNAMNVRK